MDDIAAAAGVVRRTVYAHFSSRERLIDGIAARAAESISRVLAELPGQGEPAAQLFARQTLALAGVGNQYRLLLSVARANLGHNGIHDLLGPMRATASGVIRRGQRDGEFSNYLGADVLVLAIEAIALSMLDATNAGLLDDPTHAATTAALVLMGVSPDDAETIVAQVRS